MNRQAVIIASTVLTLAFISGGAHAITYTNETRTLTFPSGNMTTHDAGFLSNAGTSDMALDAAGNPHIVGALDIGHLGSCEYRKFSHAAADWAGPKIAFESGGGTDDNRYCLITVDAADRVHVLFQHRISPDPFKLYHAWCTNASGDTPLTLGNWNAPTEISTNDVPLVGSDGSLISIGSNILLYAVGGTQIDGTNQADIRIDRADWDGSSWAWSQVGAAVTSRQGGAVSTALTRPLLTHDEENDLLHISYYGGDGYPRCAGYSVCTQPTNPVASSWLGPMELGNVSAQHLEGSGGAGVLADGRAVALVYLGSNKDGMGVNAANLTCIRSAGAAGTWGDWEIALTNDYRSMGGNLGYPGTIGFVQDGAGGLFVANSHSTVLNWDPETESWADVFTNLPSTYDLAPVGNAAVVVGEGKQESTVYTFRGSGDDVLYRGTYNIKQPAGTVIMFF